MKEDRTALTWVVPEHDGDDHIQTHEDHALQPITRDTCVSHAVTGRRRCGSGTARGALDNAALHVENTHLLPSCTV